MADATKKFIVVIDENEAARATVGALLEAAMGKDVEVLQCGDADEALRHCAAEKVDCLLFGFERSGLPGDELLRRLGNSAHEPGIPAVVLASAGDEAKAAELLKAGAHDYLLTTEPSAASVQRAVENAVEKVALQNDLKRQQQRLEFVHDVLSRAHDELFIVDTSDGTIVDASQQASMRLGRSRNELLSMKIFDIDQKFSDLEAFEGFVAEVRANATAEYESVMIESGGRRFPVEVHAHYILRTEGAYVVLIVRDITWRKDFERSLQRLSTVDPMTGIFNRRHFDEALSAEVRRSNRFQDPLSVIDIAVDGAESLELEPQQANALRARVAGQLLGCLHRSGDIVASTGDWKFSVVLPATDAEGAARVAETIRTAVADSPDSGGHPSTVSAGTASLQLGDDSETKDALIRRAAEALSRAQADGGNAVVVAGG